MKSLLLLAFAANLVFIANSDGNIPVAHHHPKCKANEEYSECPEAVCAPKSCKDVGYPIPCPDLPPDCPGKPGCICKTGYVWDHRGICIPMKDCPSCGGDRNAVSGTGLNCGKLCSNYKEKDVHCPDIYYYNACDCKPKFVYDENLQKCVKPSECTPTCKANEVYDFCPITCPPQRCDVNPALILCAIPPQPGDPDCEPGCRCIDGYLRNSTGHCVPKKDCQPPICGDDEIYNDCKKSECNAENCCEEGCVCKEGLKRADNGSCIPQEPCPPICSGPHEYYDLCPPTCPPQTCDSLHRVYRCPNNMPINKTQDCKGACRCEPDYYRNWKGECISYDDCLKCTGPHEYFSCNGYCDNECHNLKEQNQTNCPIFTYVCVEKCYCEKDYARAKNGTCIPIDQCEEPQCPINEVYVNNTGSSYCEPETCSELGFTLECQTDDVNIKKCVCINGYVRNDSGICVPKKECPSCGGDPNAEAGSGVFCTRCSNYNSSKPIACILIYKLNGCDCKKGYIYDDNLGICLRPEECTPTCRQDEIFSDCINCGCKATDCSQLGKEVPCNDEPCIQGCVCKEGYLRANNGTCVLEDQCESTTAANNTQQSAEVSAANLQKAIYAMSAAFVNFIHKEDPTTNCVFSIPSLLIALGPLAIRAKGSTSQQINRATNLQTDDQYRDAFSLLIKALNTGQQNITLDVATKLYFNEHYAANRQFINDTVVVFNAEVQNMNYGDAKAAAKEINDWVANKTHENIQNIVSPDMFSEATMMTLVNAIYFKGNWTHQFNPSHTKKMDFYVTPNQTKSIDFMQQTSTFNYSCNDQLNAQVLQMFYKESDVSFIILLPDKVDGLTELLENLRDTEVFQNSIQSLTTEEKVDVTMPKIDITTELDLVKLCKQYGMIDMFDPDLANFSGISESDTNVYISNIKQKAKIKSDESGTEAAVATGVVVTIHSLPIGPLFTCCKADNPFIFAIKLKNHETHCGICIGWDNF